jgi:DNA-binding NtrC family response regulator
MTNPIRTLEWKSQSYGHSKFRTLLVDEDPSEIRYYYGMLRTLGHEVVICGSYTAGLSILERETFDMVVVGQGTPAFEGRAVLARAVEINPAMPVLVVARTLDIDCYLEAMEIGAVEYLERCAAPRDFMRSVNAHLHTKTAA